MTNKPNGILYVGVTSDLVRRVYEHRSGFVAGFTKRYGLKRLIYFEQFATIQDAIQREHNIKHWSRAWKVRLIVASNPNWDDLFETISKQDVDGRDKPGHDELRVPISIFRQPLAFPRRDLRPGFAIRCPSGERGRRECRALNAPAASWAEKGRRPTSIVTTGSPKHSGIPCAMVGTAAPYSPRCVGLDSHRRRSIISIGLTPASRGQDHTA